MTALKKIIAVLILTIPFALYLIGCPLLLSLSRSSHDILIAFIWFVLYGIPILLLIYTVLVAIWDWAMKTAGLND